MHYASVDHIPETGDDSGVFLEYTSQPQPKTAGVLLLGTAGQIPAHSTTFFETACEINDPRDIHPFAFRVHTHSLGEFTSSYVQSGASLHSRCFNFFWKFWLTIELQNSCSISPMA